MNPGIRLSTNNNYYHFFVDKLKLALESVKSFSPEEMKRITIFYSGNQQNIFKYFFDNVQPYNTAPLDLPLLERSVKRNNDLVEIAEHIIKSMDLREEGGDVITFIQRENFRKLENSDEVRKVLESLKMPIVDAFLHKMSFEDQVKLMRRTRLLVGPHGAGFTNMIFMKRGTVVLEFFPTEFMRGPFKEMAQIHGINYFDVTGINLDPNRISKKEFMDLPDKWGKNIDITRRTRDANMRVDGDKLKDVLKEIESILKK